MIKRYDLTDNSDLEEHVKGDYVLYSDYEASQAEVRYYKDALNRIVGLTEYTAGLKVVESAGSEIAREALAKDKEALSD